MCAGEGRDLLGVLDDHPRARPTCTAGWSSSTPSSRPRAAATRPPAIESSCADAGVTAAYDGRGAGRPRARVRRVRQHHRRRHVDTRSSCSRRCARRAPRSSGPDIGAPPDADAAASRAGSPRRASRRSQFVARRGHDVRRRRRTASRGPRDRSDRTCGCSTSSATTCSKTRARSADSSYDVGRDEHHRRGCARTPPRSSNGSRPIRRRRGAAPARARRVVAPRVRVPRARRAARADASASCSRTSEDEPEFVPMGATNASSRIATTSRIRRSSRPRSSTPADAFAALLDSLDDDGWSRTRRYTTIPSPQLRTSSGSRSTRSTSCCITGSDIGTLA